MNQEQLDRATEEITKILTPYRKHAGERAANIVMALQGCDTGEERFNAIEQALHLEPLGDVDLVGRVLHAWHTCSR